MYFGYEQTFHAKGWRKLWTGEQSEQHFLLSLFSGWVLEYSLKFRKIIFWLRKKNLRLGVRLNCGCSRMLRHEKLFSISIATREVPTMNKLNLNFQSKQFILEFPPLSPPSTIFVSQKFRKTLRNGISIFPSIRDEAFSLILTEMFSAENLQLDCWILNV